MSRKNSEDSSLELLLDTMCNTFGGVMFIAILLSVMISIRGSAKSEPVPDQKEKIAEVKQQITRLQKELEDFIKATREQARTLEEMVSDPRLRLIHEIALLEQMHKEKLLAQQLAVQKVKLSRSTLKNLEIKTEKVLEEQKETEKTLAQVQSQVDQKKKVLAELTKKIGSVDLRNMYFMTVVKKEEVPYFILVNDGKIWAVGPEMQGESYVPNQAVSTQTKSGRVYCQGVPGKEVTIFSGKDLSPEFETFMKKLPPNRVPEFVISKSDAPVFFRLREILKKQKLFHGFRIQSADNDVFYYQFANQSKGSYEY